MLLAVTATTQSDDNNGHTDKEHVPEWKSSSEGSGDGGGSEDDYGAGGRYDGGSG